MKTVRTKFLKVIVMSFSIIILLFSVNNDAKAVRTCEYLNENACWAFIDAIENNSDKSKWAVNLISALVPGGTIFGFANGEYEVYVKCKEAVRQHKGLVVCIDGVDYYSGPPNNMARIKYSFNIL